MGKASRRRNRKARLRSRAYGQAAGAQDARSFLPCDLHMHSNRSDGQLTPWEVVHAAVKGGLKVISLTDHDICTDLSLGWQQHDGKDIFILQGAELSVSHEGTEQHILAYFAGEVPEAFVTFCRQRVQARAERYEILRALLENEGVAPLTPASEQAKIGEKALTRLHLAQDVVHHRYAGSISEVFERWLRELEHAESFPSAEAVLSEISAAGGFSSWAHPRGEDAQKWLPQFAQWGLNAVEGYRPFRGKNRRKKIRELAASLQLHVTGGSDNHGVALGSFSVPAAHFRSWMEPMGIWDALSHSNQ
jgi:3',5'-nucleoside bisphosphate phosphatase